MGLMIKDMKMPEDCDRGPLYTYRNDAEDICSITKEGLYHVKPGERHATCPLEEINVDTRDLDRYYRDTVYELIQRWSSGDLDAIRKSLQYYSDEAGKMKKTQQPNEDSLDYAAGRLSGMLDAFVRIYQTEKERADIDAVVKNDPAAEKVLDILSTKPVSGGWITYAALDRKTGWSGSDLLDTLKALINVGAVEFFQEKNDLDFSSFRLTPAGKRYLRTV